MLLNIDNINLIIESPTILQLQKHDPGVFYIDGEKHTINIEDFTDFIKFSYYLNLNIPDDDEDIIQLINDYFEFIDISIDSSELLRYYYSCLSYIFIYSYNNTNIDFSNLKSTLIEYLKYLKNHDKHYYYFYYLLYYLVKIEIVEKKITKDIITYDLYDIIFDNNLNF